MLFKESKVSEPGEQLVNRLNKSKQSVAKEIKDCLDGWPGHKKRLVWHVALARAELQVTNKPASVPNKTNAADAKKHAVDFGVHCLEKGVNMEKEKGLVSDAFKAFSEEAPKHAEAWMKLVQGLSSASALDHKTHNISYLAVLAALRRINGITFHVKMAKKAGASRDEIISAILVGLPAAGHVVTEVLPVAIDAYDNEK